MLSYFYENEKLYIYSLSKDSETAFQVIGHREYETFTCAMSDATYEAFVKLENIDKNTFILRFKNMWKEQVEFPEFDVQNSLVAFQSLKSQLLKYSQQAEKEGHSICNYHVKEFIECVNGLINKLDNR